MSDPAPATVKRAAAGAPRLTAISLFAGAGGLDIGCERAGFATRAAVEVDDLARETLLSNAAHYFRTLTEHGLFGDIVTLNYDELLTAADLEPEVTDLVHGGPPGTPMTRGSCSPPTTASPSSASG